MKGSVVIRLVLDTEKKKSFMAIEGSLQEASEEEKQEFRERLSHAIGYALGLEESTPTENQGPTPESVKQDFELTNEDVPACLVSPAGEENGQKEEKPAEDPAIGFGRKYPKLTAREAILQDGDRAVNYFQWFLKERKKGKFQDVSDEVVASVKRALEDKDEVLKVRKSTKVSAKQSEAKTDAPDEFEQILKKIEAFAEKEDPLYIGIDELCETLYGQSYNELAEKKDARLKQVYEKLLEINKK